MWDNAKKAVKNIAKSGVRIVGIEPDGSSRIEKQAGSVDHRGHRGDNRTPAQKRGDKARRGPRGDGR